MCATIAYVRVSTDDQSTSAQRHKIEIRHKIDEWFCDEATSGAIKARQREGFGKLLSYVRKGDTVVVTAVDRLGRNTIDVLETVEALKSKGVSVVSLREGFDLSTATGMAILGIMSTLAELERSNIKERQMAGIERAKAEGKALGRVKTIDDASVAAWRQDNNASIKQTAEHFGISTASVKRAVASIRT